MNNINFTRRAQEAIEGAMFLAQNESHSTVEVEHLLKTILKIKSVLNSILTVDEFNELVQKVNDAVAGFGRVSGSHSRPSPSMQFSTLINNATKRATDFISVPLLILLIVEDSKTSVYFKKYDVIKKHIEQLLKDKKMMSEDADDPEEKIAKFAVDMVDEARKNTYDPVIGRDDEIRQVMEILSKKTKSNVILVGKPGVGKTAIVNGLAQLIAKGESHVLNGFRLYSVDVGAMVAGSSHRGQFEERLKDLIQEAKKDKKTVLFIDEVHIILGAGKAEGSLDAANILKPGLADGSLKMIGATTYDEYRQYVTKDPAFERRFTRVNVKEQSIEDTVTVMRGLKERIEMHHGVKIADRALVYASQMGKRYISNRRLPDLAIDLIDTACASAIISLHSESPELASLRTKIWSLELEKTSIEIDLQRDPSVKSSLDEVEAKIQLAKEELRPIEESFNLEKGHINEARELKKKLEDARNRMEQAKRENNKYLVYDLQTNIIPVYEKKLAEFSDKVEVIDINNVAEVISRLSGIPISRINIKESDKLLNMNQRIKQSIFGQDEAVDTVVDSIIASRVGLCDSNKPLGSFMLLGPTGVGKTELSKAICREMYGTCDNMVVLDMSDYSSEISTTKLLGAPAGYVGCEQGGALTEPVKEMPYNLVLLDEFDHAHPSFLNVMYQLLDEGRVVDGRGVKVNFKNTIVFMTSNLGQEFIRPDYVDTNSIERSVISKFGQAFVNRVDNVIIFKHLGEDALKLVLQRELSEVNARLVEKKVTFEISPAVVDFAISQAHNSGYGARIIKRFIKDSFITTLAKIILSRESKDSMNIQVFLNNENVSGERHGNYIYFIEYAK